MKKLILFAAVIALGAVSCTQKTCPTYSKIEKATPSVEIKKQANI